MVGDGATNKVTHRRPADLAFGEIVGQERLQESLLAVAADDALDGLLIRGEKGTAKSTAVRGLAALLPDQRAVADCPYGCPPDDPENQCTDCRGRTDLPVEERPVPLVTLPLGATRERVVGSLSVTDALDGDPTFEPGLLARANRGILYVDEVNLLDDHLVDVLLDAAASGVNSVERDGVSVTHPANFTLVGTMNPEEGDLRPQLRDRFALQTTVTGADDIGDRVTIVEQALGEDPDVTDTTDEHRERLRWAREHVDDVDVSDGLLEDIGQLCREAGLDGHRGDIATARTARTLAALDGRTVVEAADVRRAAEYALPHRLQSQPFEDAPDTEDVLDDHFEGEDASDADEDAGSEETDDGAESEGGDTGDAETRDGDDSDGDPADDGGDSSTGDTGASNDDAGGSDDATGDDSETDPGENDRTDDGESSPPPAGATRADGAGTDEAGHGVQPDDAGPDRTPLVPGQSWEDVGEGSVPPLSTPDATGTVDGGSRSTAKSDATGDGPRVRTERTDAEGRVDAAASVRAARRHGRERPTERDLRQSVRAGNTTALVVFAVDASASMRPAMRTAKGTALELLKDAYQHRDDVAVVTFAGADADVVVPPTDSVSLAARHLKDLPTGDRSPIPAGIDAAREVVERADPDASAVVLVTDGRANVADGSPTGVTREAARRLAATDASVLVVDAGDESRAGVTDTIIEATDGDRIPLDALSAARVDATVRES
jgi:magnesium chelatase subunit D